MERATKLPPVALRVGGSLSTLTLVLKGYSRTDENVSCPLCQARFILLLDSSDRAAPFDPGSIHSRALAFFREKITQDHVDGHPRDQFTMR